MERSLGAASLLWQKDRLVVDTGLVRREWIWTQHGFATDCVIDKHYKSSWTNKERLAKSDWQLPGVPGDPPIGTLGEVVMMEGDDDGFTSRHLAAEINIHYPSAGITANWLIWVWPNVPGIRTQLSFEVLEDHEPAGLGFPANSRTETLPFTVGSAQRRFIGWRGTNALTYEPTDGCLVEKTDKDQLKAPQSMRWPVAVALEDRKHGLALVREGPGDFARNRHLPMHFQLDPLLGIAGTGVFAGEFSVDNPMIAPAYWTICYPNTAGGREWAFKSLERARFPRSFGSPPIALLELSKLEKRPIYRQLAHCRFKLAQIASDDLVIARICREVEEAETSMEFQPDSMTAVLGHELRAAREAGLDGGIMLPGELMAYNGEWAIHSHHVKNLVQILRLKSIGVTGITNLRDDEHILLNRRWRVGLTSQSSLTSHIATEGFHHIGPWDMRDGGMKWTFSPHQARDLRYCYCPLTVMRFLWDIAPYIALQGLVVPVADPVSVAGAESENARYSLTAAIASAFFSVPCLLGGELELPPKVLGVIKKVMTAREKAQTQLKRCLISRLGHAPDHRHWSGLVAYDAHGRKGYIVAIRGASCHEDTWTVTIPPLAKSSVSAKDMLRQDTIQSPSKGQLVLAAEPGDCQLLQFQA